MEPAAAPEVLIRREGRAGRITLNRPKALNALTLGMVREIWPALLAWKDDVEVELVLLDGAGDRGLCAGGDVRWLYDSRANGSNDARAFWAEEYRLNALISRYPKPYVSFMDGIVMGGGIGLSAHGRHRIVTERSQLAMPETSIGLIPDVGGTWLLSRAPGAVGAYLGLTGERMRGAGTIFAGFANTFVPSARLGELGAALTASDGGGVEAIITRFAEPPPASELARRADAIAGTFDFETVEEIRAALAGLGNEWANKTLAELTAKSPLSLKLTLAAIRNARDLGNLEEALNVEYRLCTRLFERGEFIEGVRALLVDKDRTPKWRPPTIEESADVAVADWLAPLPDGEELGLKPLV
ncbi:MAG: enoyl-CoA hydratase/isomerase family protein [Hyphomicrobiaceae bacterium]